MEEIKLISKGCQVIRFLNIKRVALIIVSFVLILISVQFSSLWKRYKMIETELENDIKAYIELVYNSIDSVVAFENGGDFSIARQDCVVTLFALEEYNSFNRKVNLNNLDRLISCYYRRLSIIASEGLNEQRIEALKAIDKYLRLFKECEGNKLSEKIERFNELVHNNEEFMKLISEINM